MKIQEILSLIDKLDAKLAVLLCHHNADPDAIGSAFAFKELLAHLRSNLVVEIAAASGPSRLSKSMMTVVPIEITDKPRIETADLIVLIDTNTIQQLDEWSKQITSECPIILIDHHASHPETEKTATLFVTDETASSTCEIVYRLFKEAKITPTKEVAKALFLGLAFDTRHFIIANSETIKVVADLVDIGVNVQETLPVISLPMQHSERIARLKASTRMKLIQIDHWLIAFSYVSAYQASAARALIALGAHVAVVAGKKNDEIQVSFRASRQFYDETSIHMGHDLATPLGKFMEGMGGGHSVSAGANGVGDVNDSLDFCEDLIRKRLT
jgi:phosphoesterase RecJ-like protein